MEMVSVNMSFPKGMTPYLAENDALQSFKRNAMILYPYIQSASISHGRAAEILGVKKRDLIELYNSMDIPYLNQSKEDILSELETYERVKDAYYGCCK